MILQRPQGVVTESLAVYDKSEASALSVVVISLNEASSVIACYQQSLWCFSFWRV